MRKEEVDQLLALRDGELDKLVAQCKILERTIDGVKDYDARTVFRCLKNALQESTTVDFLSAEESPGVLKGTLHIDFFMTEPLDDSKCDRNTERDETLQEAIETLQEVVLFCRENGVEVTDMNQKAIDNIFTGV